MLQVGLNNNQQNYSNNKPNIAFGFSRQVVEEVIQSSIKNSKDTVELGKKLHDGLVMKTINEEIKLNKFVDARNTAQHMVNYAENLKDVEILKLNTVLNARKIEEAKKNSRKSSRCKYISPRNRSKG